MSNQQNGRKISNFLALTSIPSDSVLTFVSSGTNYKISVADFLAALGVTGTIVQDGAVTGTPVLDKAGSVNNIRNLESGIGITALVSPENGITLNQNIEQDTGGVNLIVDDTVAKLKFRSLQAGSGINVSASNGTIQIALSGIPASTKTVVVNSINDFPAAVSGVITLEDDTEYAIRNDISTANRFVIGDNCVLSGSDSLVINLTYTGSGIMFMATGITVTLKEMTATCTSGTFMNFTGTGVEILALHDSVINADILGTIDGVRGLNFENMQFIAATNGFLFGGSNGIILVGPMLSAISAGTLLDLGTATFDGVSINSSFTTLNGASVFLDGAASSANINAGDLGVLHNCRFFGTGTILQTITTADNRWEFFLNDKIEDSTRDCMMSQIANATNTVITTINTPVKLLGTWALEHADHFTTDTAGRMTYTGLKDVEVNIDMSFLGAAVSGGSKSFAFYAALNGSIITNSAAANTTSSALPVNTVLIWRLTLTEGDFIEAWVENRTDAIDMLITDAILRLS